MPGPMSRAGRVAATLDIGPVTDREGGHERPGGDHRRATRQSNLIACETALEAAGMAIQLVLRVPAPLKSLADQVVRAASSVAANLSEGQGRCGRDRMQHWRIAYGSAREVECHLRLLVHAGVVDRRRATTALNLFDEVRAMTWRLLHPTA